MSFVLSCAFVCHFLPLSIYLYWIESLSSCPSGSFWSYIGVKKQTFWCSLQLKQDALNAHPKLIQNSFDYKVMGRIILGMNYDRKPKRRGQSLTLPHHWRGVTLFISRIISSTRIHFLIPILIINMQRIFTCSSGSVRPCAGETLEAHVRLKSSPQSPLAQPWESWRSAFHSSFNGHPPPFLSGLSTALALSDHWRTMLGFQRKEGKKEGPGVKALPVCWRNV